MGDYLSTDIASPQAAVVGEVLAGNLTLTSPSAGNFYLLMEQYTSALVLIPGSRAYLHQAVAGGAFVNSTTLYTMWTPVAAGVVATEAVALTLPNTDCYLYLFLKQRAPNVVAGAFVVGTTYEIMSIGTTDFTLIGAAANIVGTVFTATGVGAGTGTAAELPDPDTDDTIDYVVVALATPAADGIDISSIVSMMMVVMMMGMMMKAMK